MPRKNLDELLEEAIASDNVGKITEIAKASRFIINMGKDVRSAGDNMSDIVTKAAERVSNYLGASCSVWLGYDAESKQFNFREQSGELPLGLEQFAEDLRIHAQTKQKTQVGTDQGTDKDIVYYTAPLTFKQGELDEKQYGVLQIVRENNPFDELEQTLLSELKRVATLAIKNYDSQLEAATDARTGAWNLRVFNTRYSTEKSNAARYDAPYSMIIFDLNDLKVINDCYGHHKGDEVLVSFANLVKKSIKKGDTFARLGGDEFGLLLPETEEDEAKIVAQRINEKISELEFMTADNKPFRISVSTGIGSYDKNNREQDIYKLADSRMYEDKRKYKESKSNR